MNSRYVCSELGPFYTHEDNSSVIQNWICSVVNTTCVLAICTVNGLDRGFYK